MELDLTTPALLFPAVAILMLGYINRYIGTATVVRNFKKDYDTGYKHVDVARQVAILRKRLRLSQAMMTLAAFALLLATLSMFFIFETYRIAGETAFALSLVAMISSLGFSLYETTQSNKSLNIEVDDILKKEHAKKD